MSLLRQGIEAFPNGIKECLKVVDGNQSCEIGLVL